MSRLIQVLVGASPGDAVTEHALEIHRALDPLVESHLLALHVDPRLSTSVRPLHSLPGDGSAHDVLFVHVSIGEPEVAGWVMGRPGRLVVYYHNISPAAAFEPYSPRFARLLEEGRHELEAYSARTELALAASQFSARELGDLGYDSVKVCPLLLDPRRLLDKEPHGPTEIHLRTGIKGPVVLFVGQLLPHKRPDFLIQAYFTLCTHLLPESHLIMVGAGRLREYTRALKTYVKELNANRAWLTGHVSDAMLAAFYRRADVFATASEHEGFCAPLVEAMAFDVPVVARPYAAVPETLDGAGLLTGREDGPELLAEVLAEVLTRPALSADLAQRGRERAAKLDPGAARSALIDNVRGLL